MDVSDPISRLRFWAQTRGFAGWDPYDALNSPLARLLSFGTKSGRIAWTQFFRRSPINTRSLFAVPKRLNAKGLGLFLEAYSKLYAEQRDPTLLLVIKDLLVKLNDLQSSGWAGNCWGYPFDWQSQAAFVPAGTPTIVNTSFIGHALLDCHERTGIDGALDLALAIPPFFLKDLGRTAEDGLFCFSYTPLDRNFVHNANMLAASLLARLGKHANNMEWLHVARQSMAHSMENQRPDGSWPYAETDFQNWTDSFHTGFNLEALRWFLRLGDAPPLWQEAYHRGVKFYAGHFFLPDGTPKYYHDRVYPIDVHAPAEAIYFFSGEGDEYRALTEKILAWMLTNLWDDRKGYFYFRKTRFGTNRIPYMRWSQAWGMRALAEYYVHNTN